MTLNIKSQAYKVDDRVVSINPSHHPGVAGTIVGILDFRGCDLAGEDGYLYSTKMDAGPSKCLFKSQDICLLQDGLKFDL